MLHFAVWKGAPTVAQFLITLGADIHATTKYSLVSVVFELFGLELMVSPRLGESVLHYAVRNSAHAFAMAELLVSLGADTTYRSPNGTAAEVAVDPAVKDILKHFQGMKIFFRSCCTI